MLGNIDNLTTITNDEIYQRCLFPKPEPKDEEKKKELKAKEKKKKSFIQPGFDQYFNLF